ncbi:MAG: hypothetical protein PHS79_01490 [Patescibacteria group bacterium]|nr:hypothetical protein [Patescibacteria group bacterium]
MTEVNVIASKIFAHLVAKMGEPTSQESFEASDVAGFFAKTFLANALDTLKIFESQGWTVHEIFTLNNVNPRWVKHLDKLFRMQDALLEAGYDAAFTKAIFWQRAVLELSDETRLPARLRLMQSFLHEKSDVLRAVITYAAIVYVSDEEIAAWRKDQLDRCHDTMSYLRWLGKKRRPVVQPSPTQEPVIVPAEAEPQSAVNEPTEDVVSIAALEPAQTTEPEPLVIVAPDPPPEPHVESQAPNPESSSFVQHDDEALALLTDLMLDVQSVPRRPRVAIVTRVTPPPPPPPDPSPPALKATRVVGKVDTWALIHDILREFDPRFTKKRWQMYLETKRWFGITRDPDSETMQILARLASASGNGSVEKLANRLLLASILLGRDLIAVKAKEIKKTVLAPAKPSGKKLRRLFNLPPKILAFRFHVLMQHINCNPFKYPQCLTHKWEDVRCNRALPLHLRVYDVPPPCIDDLNVFREQIVEIKDRVAGLKLRGIKEWWRPDIIGCLAVPTSSEFHKLIGPAPQSKTGLVQISADEAYWRRHRATRPKL